MNTNWVIAGRVRDKAFRDTLINTGSSEGIHSQVSNNVASSLNALPNAGRIGTWLRQITKAWCMGKDFAVWPELDASLTFYE